MSFPTGLTPTVNNMAVGAADIARNSVRELSKMGFTSSTVKLPMMIMVQLLDDFHEKLLEEYPPDQEDIICQKLMMPAQKVSMYVQDNPKTSEEKFTLYKYLLTQLLLWSVYYRELKSIDCKFANSSKEIRNYLLMYVDLLLDPNFNEKSELAERCIGTKKDETINRLMTSIKEDFYHCRLVSFKTCKSSIEFLEKYMPVNAILSDEEKAQFDKIDGQMLLTYLFPEIKKHEKSAAHFEKISERLNKREQYLYFLLLALPVEENPEPYEEIEWEIKFAVIYCTAHPGAFFGIVNGYAKTFLPEIYQRLKLLINPFMSVQWMFNIRGDKWMNFHYHAYHGVFDKAGKYPFENLLKSDIQKLKEKYPNEPGKLATKLASFVTPFSRLVNHLMINEVEQIRIYKLLLREIIPLFEAEIALLVEEVQPKEVEQIINDSNSKDDSSEVAGEVVNDSGTVGEIDTYEELVAQLGHRPVISTKLRVITKLLKETGFTLKRQKGSHQIWKKGEKLTVVPIHGSEVKESIARSIYEAIDDE